MKRIILITVMLAGFAVNTVLASDESNVPPVVKSNFEKEFPKASYAKWDKVEHTSLYQVRFVYNDQALLAFIHEDGSVLATARNITQENLPFKASETLRNRFHDYDVIQIEELTTATEVSYFITLENDRSNLYLRVFNNGTSSVVKKEKKKIPGEMVKK
jgi:hypothetical protein